MCLLQCTCLHRNVRLWETPEVMRWLKDTKLEELHEVFYGNAVNGSKLLRIKPASLMVGEGERHFMCIFVVLCSIPTLRTSSALVFPHTHTRTLHHPHFANCATQHHTHTHLCKTLPYRMPTAAHVRIRPCLNIPLILTFTYMWSCYGRVCHHCMGCAASLPPCSSLPPLSLFNGISSSMHSVCSFLHHAVACSTMLYRDHAAHNSVRSLLHTPFRNLVPRQI